MQVKKGDRIRTKYQEWHRVIEVWDNVITTDKGHVHVANVVEVEEETK